MSRQTLSIIKKEKRRKDRKKKKKNAMGTVFDTRSSGEEWGGRGERNQKILPHFSLELICQENPLLRDLPD